MLIRDIVDSTRGRLLSNYCKLSGTISCCAKYSQEPIEFDEIMYRRGCIMKNPLLAAITYNKNKRVTSCTQIDRREFSRVHHLSTN